MTKGSTTWSYSYNADGIRTQRTNGTTTYSYAYNGGELEKMTVGSDILSFAYDAEGVPLTVRWNGTYYFYITNLQGDVIAITDQTGAVVVTYTYDSWGNLLSTTGSLTSTLGAINPLRYRGYVFDYETGLYYLQSRYYNPQMGRFLNADIYAATGQGFIGNNMFAYCLNNPVNMVDFAGDDPVAIGVAVGAVLLVSCLVFVSISPQVHQDIKTISVALNQRIALQTDDLEKTITRKMEVSLAKAATKNTPSYHVHHIVAQSDPRASQSRWILEYLFEFGVNDRRNLVVVDSRIHQRLHTNAYYLLVEHMIVDAFSSAKPYKEEQIKNVEAALEWMKKFIAALSLI